MTDYELYHHGVKGQKWGIIRTAAQLGHRVANAVGKGAKTAKNAAIAKAKQSHQELKEKKYYKKLKKKKLSQMTEKEIKDLTNHVKIEAELKDARYESRVQNARKFYNNVAQDHVDSVVSKMIENAFESKE